MKLEDWQREHGFPIWNEAKTERRMEGDQAMNELNPMPHDPQSWISAIWEALEYARDLYTDDQWDEICMAMAWTTEEIEA